LTPLKLITPGYLSRNKDKLLNYFEITNSGIKEGFREYRGTVGREEAMQVIKWRRMVEESEKR
jgi:hypothetical protein